jgi:hypothetical protein
MSNPSKSHYKALERIWKYLANKTNYKLVFYKNNPKSTSNSLLNNNLFNLIGYVDADWGGDLVERKSTIKFIFTINNTPIS